MAGVRRNRVGAIVVTHRAEPEADPGTVPHCNPPVAIGLAEESAPVGLGAKPAGSLVSGTNPPANSSKRAANNPPGGTAATRRKIDKPDRWQSTTVNEAEMGAVDEQVGATGDIASGKLRPLGHEAEVHPVQIDTCPVHDGGSWQRTVRDHAHRAQLPQGTCRAKNLTLASAQRGQPAVEQNDALVLHVDPVNRRGAIRRLA